MAFEGDKNLFCVLFTALCLLKPGDPDPGFVLPLHGHWKHSGNSLEHNFDKVLRQYKKDNFRSSFRLCLQEDALMFDTIKLHLEAVSVCIFKHRQFFR